MLTAIRNLEFSGMRWTLHGGLTEEAAKSRGEWTLYDGITDRAGWPPHIECFVCKTRIVVGRRTLRIADAPTLIPINGIRCLCDGADQRGGE